MQEQSNHFLSYNLTAFVTMHQGVETPTTPRSPEELRLLQVGALPVFPFWSAHEVPRTLEVEDA